MDCDDPGRIARSVVGHPYRRVVLSVLDSRVAPVSVRELSRAVLAFDRSGTVFADTDADAPALDDDTGPVAVETMDAQLHHVHLPRLAAAGLVEYDAEGSVVTDWCHPAVGDRWLTAPPYDRLARTIADARSASMRAD
jgi:hypothetical protein